MRVRVSMLVVVVGVVVVSVVVVISFLRVAWCVVVISRCYRRCRGCVRGRVALAVVAPARGVRVGCGDCVCDVYAVSCGVCVCLRGCVFA